MVKEHLEQFKDLEEEQDALQHNVPQGCHPSGNVFIE